MGNSPMNSISARAALSTLNFQYPLATEPQKKWASTERMLDELGITPDTLYQRRRRYLKDLDKLREQYPS